MLPTLQTISFSEQTECCCGGCCEKPEQPQEPCNNQDNHCNNVCNPLLSCGTCIGFVIASPTIIPAVQQYAIVENNYTEISPSQVSLPVWQPPKIS